MNLVFHTLALPLVLIAFFGKFYFLFTWWTFWGLSACDRAIKTCQAPSRWLPLYQLSLFVLLWLSLLFLVFDPFRT